MKRSIRKYLLACAVFLFVLSGCSGKSKETVSDMSGYENFQVTEHVFLDSDVKDMLVRMKNKETFAVYFGFSRCPWCNEALPVLNESAAAAGRKVYYINTRPNANVTNNTEIDDYDLLLDAVGDYFSYDNEGNHRLYVPFVFFIRDGEVAAAHEGTVEDHDATERKMEAEEAEALRRIYDEGFALLK